MRYKPHRTIGKGHPNTVRATNCILNSITHRLTSYKQKLKKLNNRLLKLHMQEEFNMKDFISLGSQQVEINEGILILTRRKKDYQKILDNIKKTKHLY